MVVRAPLKCHGAVIAVAASFVFETPRRLFAHRAKVREIHRVREVKKRATYVHIRPRTDRLRGGPPMPCREVGEASRRSRDR